MWVCINTSTYSNWQFKLQFNRRIPPLFQHTSRKAHSKAKPITNTFVDHQKFPNRFFPLNCLLALSLEACVMARVHCP